MTTALKNTAVARKIKCGNAPKLNYHFMKFSVYLVTLYNPLRAVQLAVIMQYRYLRIYLLHVLLLVKLHPSHCYLYRRDCWP
jgi:hypothetical protein